MFSDRWCDLIDPKKAVERQKSGDEIVADVMAKAGLKFGGE